MITLLIVIGTTYLIYREATDVIYCDFGDKMIGIFGGLLLSLVIVLLLSGAITIFAPTEYVIDYQQDILALNGKLSGEGSFFLGTGSYNEEMKYFYLVEKKGGKVIKSISMDGVVLKNSNNPRIVKLTQKFKSDFLNNNFFCTQTGYYEIYIPEGTIKYDYQVPPFN